MNDKPRRREWLMVPFVPLILLWRILWEAIEEDDVADDESEDDR